MSTVYGIPIHVHLILLLFLPFLAYGFLAFSPDMGTLFSNLLIAVTFIGILYGSVLLHELGHAWGSHLVGGSTDQIILLPIGGVAIGYGSDKSPRTELLVVALGPAVSVLLALLGWGVYYALYLLLTLTDFTTESEIVAGVIRYILTFFILIGSLNTMVTVFNLCLPIFPMDSARLLRAGFSLKYKPAKVTRVLTQIGIGLAIFIVFLWLTGIQLPIPYVGQGSFWLSIIAILGLQACLQEQTRIQYQDVYSAQDNWAGRTVFYDSDAMSLAARRSEAELGRLGFLARLFTRKSRQSADSKDARKPKGTIKRSERLENMNKAKIIDLSEDLDPSTISDIEVLKQMMKQAANAENFPRAGKIQNRINQLKGKSS